MQNKRIHGKMLLVETNASIQGQLCCLSVTCSSQQSLEVVCVLGFCTSSCHWPQDGAGTKVPGLSRPRFQEVLLCAAQSCSAPHLDGPALSQGHGTSPATSWGILSSHPRQVCGIYHVALRHRKIWVFSFQPSGETSTKMSTLGCVIRALAVGFE